MKKIIALVLAVLMVAVCFTSCGKKNSDFVATDAADLIKEDFGIAVKKGNKELLDSIDIVLKRLMDEGKIDEYVIKHSK